MKKRSCNNLVSLVLKREASTLTILFIVFKDVSPYSKWETKNLRF